MWTTSINRLTQRLFITVHTQPHFSAVLIHPQAVYNYIKGEAYSFVHDIIKNGGTIFGHFCRIRML